MFVYFRPDQTYTFDLSGKFGLTQVTLNQDMSLVYDQFYLEYLRYSLAQFMCNEYNIAFAPEKLDMLKKYEKKLMDVSPIDLTMKKMSFMSGTTSMNWAQANIGKGFTPI